MSAQITPDIEHLYDQDSISKIIDTLPFFKLTLENGRAEKAPLVIPVIKRDKGYKAHQFDLCLLIGHSQDCLFELLLIRDFIRRKTNIAPAIHFVEQISDVREEQIFGCIKEQVSFLNSPANVNLASAPAAMFAL